MRAAGSGGPEHAPGRRIDFVGSLRSLLRDTSITATVLAVLVGMVFCFLPGLDAPNYHAALLMAPLVALIAGPAAVFAATRAVVAHQSPFRAALRAVAIPALLPLLLLLLNGFRVRQCDVAAGIGFLFIGPVFSTLWAALLGAALACWAPVRRRRLVGVLGFFGVFLAWAIWDVLHIYNNPAIFIFNPFVGYLQGAMYDSVVDIDSRILLYRLNNAVQLAFILVVTRLCWDATRARASFATLSRRPLGRVFGALLLGAIALVFFAMRGSIGYEVSRAEVQSRLGGRLEDERIILYYDRASIALPEAEALLEAHRFRLDQIEHQLGAVFPRKIGSYVYGSPAQKRLMMGAGQVYIAKPWLDEIHLNRVPPGQPVIRHELAHVVLGLFAAPPFHIPTRMCVFPHMALVEGAAETFEWDTGALTPHQWAHAMRAAEKAVDLRGLLSPSGFLGQGSDKAYTLVGSFVRHLVDRYGMPLLHEVYADGDFEGVYGQPVDTLVTEWEAFVDGLEVPDDAAGLATGRFNVAAIQFRPCGLDVARVEQEARNLAAQTDAESRRAARERYEQVVAWIPEDAQKRLPLLRLAVQSNDLAAVEKAYADYLGVQGNRNVVSDAEATELLADARARAGDLASALELYRSLADTPQPEDKKRSTLVKLGLASEPTRAALALPYILDGRASTLEKAVAALPDDLMVGYLEARRIYQDKRLPEALDALSAVLERLEAVPPPTRPEELWLPWVTRETARLLAECYWQMKRWVDAEAAYLRVAALTPYEGDAERYRDLAEWAAWKTRRVSP